MSVIQISVNQSKIKIDPLRLKKAAKEILNALDCIDAELSLVIVDDEEMADLNRRYRKIDGTTDVLSFSMNEGEYAHITPRMLGDVVICAPTAHSMSIENNIPLSMVLDLLLVHGILHLIGYDHEVDNEQAREMGAMTLRMMKLLGYPENGLTWFLNSEA